LTDDAQDPTEHSLARSRDRIAGFQAWLEQLRAGDPAFAEASALRPWDMTEWQSAIYLLTGSGPVWSTLGSDVLSQRAIGPIIRELDQPCRPWPSSQHTVMARAAHFWNVDHRPAKFPHAPEHFSFQRWITACHLRHMTLPVLTITRSLV